MWTVFFFGLVGWVCCGRRRQCGADVRFLVFTHLLICFRPLDVRIGITFKFARKPPVILPLVTVTGWLSHRFACGEPSAARFARCLNYIEVGLISLVSVLFACIPSAPNILLGVLCIHDVEVLFRTHPHLRPGS